MSTNYAAAACCMAALSVLVLMPAATQAEDSLTYSQLRGLIKSGKASQIQKVVITNGESKVEVQMAGSDKLNAVTIPTETKENLIESLDQAGVDLEVHEPSKTEFWFSIVSSFFLPILLLVGFMFMFQICPRTFTPPITIKVCR